MAKGPFILHGASKKIGNMVVYKNPNSNNADTTVAREYVAEVKNPKTRQQAIQRMRMLPAQQFYRAFRELLDHSWQGIKYGGRSYAHFMKVALADKTITIPYLLKGTTAFVPGAYPVSQGSLVGVSIEPADEVGDSMATSIKIGSLVITSTTTIGDLSTAIIASNAGFNDGDFITVVMVSVVDGNWVPAWRRFTLDTASTALLSTTGFSFSVHESSSVQYLAIDASEGATKGAAVIHSRKPAEGSTVWQRSNASLVLATGAIEDYTTTEAEEAAIASYQSNAGNVNAHWYLNGGAQ